MKIKVIDTHGVRYVDAAELDKLIDNREIMAFERSQKLVILGFHPVRQKKAGFHHPERRKKETEH